MSLINDALKRSRKPTPSAWSTDPQASMQPVEYRSASRWPLLLLPMLLLAVVAGVVVAEFDRRRQVVVAGLNKLPNVSCATPKGAFYAFPNIKRTGWKAKPLANALLDRSAGQKGGEDLRPSRLHPRPPQARVASASTCCP